MASIADVYITVLPETSQIADGVKRALRSVDTDAREAGRRWGREIRSGMGDVGVRIDGDINPAQRELRRLDREIERPRKIKVDVDQGGLREAASNLRASHTTMLAGAAGLGAVMAPNAFASVATAVAELSGAFGLIPSVAGAAGLAIGSLKVATLGFADAMKEIRDPEKFGEAIAQLSPNAQEAARAIQGLLPQLDTLKFTVQDAFFSGIGNQIQALATTYLPMFQTVMSQMASSAGSALKDVGDMLMQPGRQGDMSAMTNNMAVAFDKLSQALEPIVSAFVDIGLVGSGFLPALADAATRAAQSFATFVGEARASGELQNWIQGGIDAMTQLGRIAGDLGSIFMSFVQPGSDGLLGVIENITSTISDFLNSPAGSGAMQAFMATVSTTVSALMPALSSLLQAIAPILAGLGQLAAVVIQSIAPALDVWFQAMTPVIQQLTAAFVPVLQALQPVLTQVAFMLADQMVSGIQQILPVLVPFVQQMGQLLIAVMPLLPPLVQLATAAMPAFQQIVTLILPPLTQLAGLLTEQANTVIPLVATQVTMLAGVFGTQWQAISGAVATAANVIGPLLDALSTKIQQILDGPIGKILGVLAGPLPRAISALTGSMPAGGVPATGFNTATSTLPFPAFGTPQQGGLANAQRQRRGAAPIAPSVGVPMTTLPVPPVSTYVAPPPAVKGAGGGSSAFPTTYGYAGDAALLANVPAGRYTQTQGADLTQGLADCSSAVEDLVNLMDGRSTAGRSMSTGNAAEWLTAHGFLPGTMPGAFNVGFNSSHMQATLPGGTPFNWGSDAAAARGGVGGTGAFDPAFTQHYYRPVLGGADGAAMSGSPLASAYPETGYTPTGDPKFDKRLRDASQRVDDRADALTRAQMKYDQVMANGKATALQRKTAEDALTRAKREHADAQTDLNSLMAEGNDLEAKGAKGGSTGGEQLGQDLMSGIGEIFGLGTLFKDPTQFGLFKIFKAFMGLNIKDDQGGGTASSLFPSGGGGGGGGLLDTLTGFIPKPFGNLNGGSPGDAPGQFMPAMPNSGGGGGLVAPGGVLADPNSPPGVAGPGNERSMGSYNDFRGANFGYSATGVKDQVNSAHLQNIRQPIRSLPS